MRKKVGTILDEELILKAKQVAILKKQSFSQLLEDALKIYLITLEKKHGKDNITQNTKGIMRIPVASLKTLMEEEIYET